MNRCPQCDTDNSISALRKLGIAPASPALCRHCGGAVTVEWRWMGASLAMTTGGVFAILEGFGQRLPMALGALAIVVGFACVAWLAPLVRAPLNGAGGG